MQLPSPAAVAGRNAIDPLTDLLHASLASAGKLLITTQGLKTTVFNTIAASVAKQRKQQGMPGPVAQLVRALC